MFNFSADGQTNLNYQKPHKDILSLADVTPAPLMSMNDESTVALLMYRSSFKSIDELSEEEYRLAGLRINPKTNISSRARYYTNLKLLDVESGKEMTIQGLPEKSRITNVRWSHSENHIAFTNIALNSLDLWVIDINAKSARKLSNRALNANMGSVITWTKDDLGLIVKVLPRRKE